MNAWWRRALLALFLIGVVAAAYAHLDALAGLDLPSAPVADDGAGAYHAGKPRVFVLWIDSLRYETASDANLMPALNQLKHRGLYAKVTTSFDPISTPALKAAFTGRDQFALLGFVRNFGAHGDPVPSVFTQAAAQGLSHAAWADSAMAQFSDAFPIEHCFSYHLGEGTDIERENRSVRAAMSAFLAERYDVVVAEIVYTDHAAHRFGVGHATYTEAFAEADRMVAELAAQLPKDSTLLVMGDHGHTLDGRHSMGLDVPTFAVYVGLGFAVDANLGSIPITDHRYFLSWALKVPLTGHLGSDHRDALVAAGDWPTSFATPHTGARPTTPPWSAFAAVAGVVMLWVGLSALMLMQPRTRAFALLWGLSALSVSASYLLPNSVALQGACGVAALTLGGAALRAPLRIRLLTGATMLGALVMFGWGHALALLRPSIHGVKSWTVAAVWLVLGALLLWLARRTSPAQALLWLLAPVMLLAFPTVYSYGYASALTPLLFVTWALLLQARTSAANFPWHLTFPERLRRHLPWFGLLVVVLWMQPFMSTTARFFRFGWWHVPVAAFDPGSGLHLALLVLVAKVVIFWRPQQGKLAHLATLLVIPLLMVRQFGVVPLTPAWDLVAVVVLAASAWLARWRKRSGLTRVLGLATLFYTVVATVALPVTHYGWLDLLLAALVVTAYAVRHLAPAEHHRPLHTLLLVVGVLMAGWSTLTWSLHGLEWKFLYTFLDAAVVEANVWWCAPFIFLRFALPVVLARRLVAEQLPDTAPTATPQAFVWVGAKFAAICLMVIGMAVHNAGTGVYLDAVQQSAVLAALWLGLL